MWTRERLIGIAVGAATTILTLILLELIPGPDEPGLYMPLPFELASADSRPELPKMACTDIQDVAKIKRLMERGFDSAFTAQIGQLYKVYTTNVPSVEKQREYTKKGMENAIVAYRIGIAGVEAWEC